MVISREKLNSRMTDRFAKYNMTRHMNPSKIGSMRILKDLRTVGRSNTKELNIFLYGQNSK